MAGKGTVWIVVLVVPHCAVDARVASGRPYVVVRK
jgi:hypothetical protein